MKVRKSWEGEGAGGESKRQGKAGSSVPCRLFPPSKGKARRCCGRYCGRLELLNIQVVHLSLG